MQNKKPAAGGPRRGLSSSRVRELGRRLLPVGREPLVDQSDDGIDILVLHALLLGDKLVQLIAKQKGMQNKYVDAIVALGDERLAANRKKAAA